MEFLKEILVFLKEYETDSGAEVKVLGILVAAIALLWTVGKGLKAFFDTIKDKRDKELANYIILFSDDKQVKRLSGVNGLVRYASLMYNQLFYLCVSEKEPLIQEFIREALEQVCSKRKKRSIRINQFLIEYCIKKDILSAEIPHFKEKGSLIKFLTNSNIDNRIEREINRKNSGLLPYKPTEMSDYIQLSSDLLAMALKKASFQSMKGVLFIESSLYKASWKYCSLQNVAFVKNVERHAKGIGNRIEQVYMFGDDLYDSWFFKCDCSDLHIFHTNFRKSVFVLSSIRQKKVQEAESKASKNHESKASKNHESKASKNHEAKASKNHESTLSDDIFSASRFIFVSLAQCKIVKAEWKGCIFGHCQFNNINFTANKWPGAIFINCKFKDVTWNKDILEKAEFIRCTFKNVKFKEADLQELSFKYCRFLEDVNFIQCKNINSLDGKGKKTKAFIEMVKEEYVNAQSTGNPCGSHSV